MENRIVKLDDESYVWYYDQGYYNCHKPNFSFHPLNNIHETIKDARSQISDSVVKILFDEEIEKCSFHDNKESYCELFFVIASFFSINSYTVRLFEIKGECKLLERLDPNKIETVECYCFAFEGEYIKDNEKVYRNLEITGIESDNPPNFNERLKIVQKAILNRNVLNLSESEIKTFEIKKIHEPELEYEYIYLDKPLFQ